MNARVASTPHSSSSACGTAAAALSSAAASLVSFAAARESLLPAFSEAKAAAGYMSLTGVVNASPTTTAARETTTSGEEEAFASANTSRGAVVTCGSASSIIKNTVFYNVTEWTALQQQQRDGGQQRHLEEQQLQLWERVLEASHISPGVVSGSSSWRNEERSGKKQRALSSIACSVVGGERAAAVVKERLAAGRGECNDGSDCSTRSCATGILLQKKEAADSSSDETRFYRTSSRIGSSYSSSTTTGDDDQSFFKNRCSITGAQRDQQHLVEEDYYHSSCSNNVEGLKGKGFAAESGECMHARRSSRSRRRDTSVHSRRRQKERDASGKPRQQESRHSIGRSGGRREVQVTESRTAAASRIPVSYFEGGGRKNNYFHVLERENTAAEEDAVPEDTSIVAPACLTSRCNTRKVVTADVAVPTAKPAFCAASAVSAVVVAEAAALGHRGGTHTAVASPPASLPLTTAAAGGSWFDAFYTAGIVGGGFSVANKKGKAIVGEEVAATVIATSPHLDRGHNTSPPFHEKPVRAKDSAAGEEDVESGRIALTAAGYSGKEQELRHWSTVGLLSVQAGVDLPAAAGGDGNLRRCGTAVAGNNSRSGCEEKSRRGEEDGEGDVAARREEALRKGMSAATARRGGGLTTASVSYGGTTGLRIAASTAALQVGAAAAAADRTHRYYHREDTSGVGRMLSSSSAQGRTSTRGGRRAAAAVDAGAGEGTPGKREGKDVTMPNDCAKKDISEPEAPAAAHVVCDGDAASAPASGRELLHFDLKCRPPGVAAGGGEQGGSSRCGSSSFMRDGTDMAAGSDRGGRPRGLMLCPASGGGGGGGGDTKTATGCVGAPRGNDFRYNSRHAGTANMPRATTVMNRPTRVEAGRQRFLILDSPSDENLPAYIQEMKSFNVTHLVRTCEAAYDDALVRESGICTHEWIFPDGEPPPEEVIDEWLALCNSVSSQQRAAAIAVHCVAGLGRAPVLVAVALIEKGMDPMDAIMFIRERRKGAINRRQLQFLKSYRRRSHMQRCCIRGCSIM